MTKRAILLASLKTINVIRTVVLTAGLAAITAVAASWLMRLVTGGSRLGWASPLQVFGMEIAGAFLIAALGTASLMPRMGDASRAGPGARRPASVLILLLAVLAIATLLQVPSLATWWAEDHVLLALATGSERDPSGLRLIPATVLFSLPALAALALLTFVLTSIVGILARAELTFALLAACVFLQAGLVVGEQFLLGAVAALGATVLDAIAQSPDAKATAQVTDWLARHNAAAGGLAWRLVWILGGYAVTAAVSGVLTRGRILEPVEVVSVPTPTPAPVVAVPVQAAVVAAPVAATSSVVSTTASAFPHLSYSVRPRQNFLDFFLRHYSTYDISSIPPSRQSSFSFSWKTGRLRREPNGPDLLAVHRGDRHGVLSRRDHVVTDVASGSVIGLLRAASGGWEIVDQSGAPYGRIVEEKSGVGYIVYLATINEEAICRFTWAMQGLTVASSGLDVEFLSTVDGAFARGFALAIAPVVEHKARRANERRT